VSKKNRQTNADIPERLRKHLSRFRLTVEEFARLWEYLGMLGALDVQDEEDFGVLCEKAENLHAVLEVDRTREEQITSGVRVPIDHGPDAEMGDVTPGFSVTVLTPSERARNTALIHYRVRQASFDQSVQWFRREVLAGNLLGEDDALIFAASPVLAILSREDFAEHGLSPRDHSVQDVEEKRQYDADAHKVHWHLTGTIMPSGVKMNVHRQGEPRPPILWCMALQADGNYWKTGQAVRESSVLHDLLSVSQSLVRQYGWSEVEAPIFVLTGMMPHSNPIEITTDYASSDRPVITIKTEPWVSWKTIEKSYKAQQKDIYEVIPGEIGKRNAALFAFVTEYMNEDGTLPGKGERRALMESWNERADEVARRWEAAGQPWRFSRLEEFNRNLRRTHEEVLHLKYPDNLTRLHRMYASADMPGFSSSARNQSLSADSHLDSQEE